MTKIGNRPDPRKNDVSQPTVGSVRTGAGFELRNLPRNVRNSSGACRVLACPRLHRSSRYRSATRVSRAGREAAHGIFATAISSRERDAGVIRPISVSYTHLRAHETVLDLVCRLLL